MKMIIAIIAGYAIANMLYALNRNLLIATWFIPSEELQKERTIKAQDRKYRTIIQKSDGDLFSVKPSLMKEWRWADDYALLYHPEITPKYKVINPINDLGEEPDLWAPECRSARGWIDYTKAPKAVWKKYRAATPAEELEIAAMVSMMEQELMY
jgi:hypothetical protein